MNLVNDLVRVISAYTTEKVTLDLLTLSSDLTQSLYSDTLWITKAAVESCGLTVNRDIIARGDWYPYYLLVNNTYYGKLVRGFPSSANENIAPLVTQASTATRTGGWMIIYKRPDLEINILETISDRLLPIIRIPFHERIRKIKVVATSNYRSHLADGPYFLLLTERGRLYTINRTQITIIDVSTIDSAPIVFLLQRNGFLTLLTGLFKRTGSPTVIVKNQPVSQDVNSPWAYRLDAGFVSSQVGNVHELTTGLGRPGLDKYITSRFTLVVPVGMNPLLKTLNRVVFYDPSSNVVLRSNKTTYYIRSSKLITGSDAGRIQHVITTTGLLIYIADTASCVL